MFLSFITIKMPVGEGILQDRQVTNRTVKYFYGENKTLWLISGQTLVILSDIPLPDGAFEDVAEKTRCLPYTVEYQTGETITLTGVVNPVRAVINQAGKHRKVELKTREEVEEWLDRKLSPAGNIDSLQVGSPQNVRAIRKDGRIYKTFWQFQATLTITNPETLTEILTCGIGKGKNLGAGLVIAS